MGIHWLVTVENGSITIKIQIYFANRREIERARARERDRGMNERPKSKVILQSAQYPVSLV